MANYKFTRRDKNGNIMPSPKKPSIFDRIMHGFDVAEEKNNAFKAYTNTPEFEKKMAIIEDTVKTVGMSVVHGIANTITLTAKVAGNTAYAGAQCALGDKTGAKDSLWKAGAAIKDRVVNTAKSVKTIASTGKYCFVHWNDLPPEIKAKAVITTVGSFTGAYVAAGLIHDLGIPTMNTGDILELPMYVPDISDVDYIENGKFVGDASDLQDLIALGEIDDTQHIETIRDPQMVIRFYDEHGLLPKQGYEVHHIIPLSQGGSDTTDNMVLIRSDLHHQITTAHNAFYGWHE